MRGAKVSILGGSREPTDQPTNHPTDLPRQSVGEARYRYKVVVSSTAVIGQLANPLGMVVRWLGEG